VLADAEVEGHVPRHAHRLANHDVGAGPRVPIGEVAIASNGAKHGAPRIRTGTLAPGDGLADYEASMTRRTPWLPVTLVT
jgi:hypothetical protein